VLKDADLDSGIGSGKADRHPVEVLLEPTIERFGSHSRPPDQILRPLTYIYTGRHVVFVYMVRREEDDPPG
jgi:hypothetical protein